MRPDQHLCPDACATADPIRIRLYPRRNPPAIHPTSRRFTATNVNPVTPTHAPQPGTDRPLWRDSATPAAALGWVVVTIFFPDISSYQTGFPLTGIPAIVVKATEGIGYVNPDYTRGVHEAQDGGLVQISS